MFLCFANGWFTHLVYFVPSWIIPALVAPCLRHFNLARGKFSIIYATFARSRLLFLAAACCIHIKKGNLVHKTPSCGVSRKGLLYAVLSYFVRRLFSGFKFVIFRSQGINFTVASKLSFILHKYDISIYIYIYILGRFETLTRIFLV